MAGEHLGHEVGRQHVRPRAGDVEAGRDLEEVALGILGGVDLAPHVPLDHLHDAIAPPGRPARPGGHRPADVAARRLERQQVVVEAGREADVVQHGRDGQQLGIPHLDARRRREAARPVPGADAVVEQGGRAEAGGDLEGGAGRCGVGQAGVGDAHVSHPAAPDARARRRGPATHDRPSAIVPPQCGRAPVHLRCCRARVRVRRRAARGRAVRLHRPHRVADRPGQDRRRRGRDVRRGAPRRP